MYNVMKAAALCVFVFFAAHSGAEQAAEKPKVLLHTSMGDVVIELFPEEAPITVENFLAYVDSNFYDGTIFHRIVPGFVVQGGGMTFDYTPKQTREPIRNESSNMLENRRGTLSMARTNAPHSATSQFFINLTDNPSLNATTQRPGYAVFGRVIDGMDVVDAMAEAPRGENRRQPEAPDEVIQIIRAERLNGAAESGEPEAAATEAP